MKTIQQLIDSKALFVINNSGGKDSQAMLIKVRKLVPDSQLLVIHANLEGMEWDGTESHARDMSGDLPFITVKAGKTFFDMVRHRGMFPSPQYRQCTSDLKRAPIQKAIRHYMKDNGYTVIVNCIGIRAEESTSRAKMQSFRVNKGLTTQSRQAYDWYPIFDYKLQAVWDEISDAGQQRHWVYDQGMSRLSCAVCIMSSKADLRTVARIFPDRFNELVELEKEVGHMMMMPRKGQEPVNLVDFIK